MSSQFATLQEALTTAYDRTFAHLTENIHRDSSETLTIDDLPNSDLVSYQERLARAYCTEKDIENALENTLRNCFRQHQMLIRYVDNGCIFSLKIKKRCILNLSINNTLKDFYLLVDETHEMSFYIQN